MNISRPWVSLSFPWLVTDISLYLSTGACVFVCLKQTYPNHIIIEGKLTLSFPTHKPTLEANLNVGTPFPPPYFRFNCVKMFCTELNNTDDSGCPSLVPTFGASIGSASSALLMNTLSDKSIWVEAWMSDFALFGISRELNFW